MDNKRTLFNKKDSLFCSLYPKLRILKEFYIKRKFFHKPRFHIIGDGGENIKGYPGKSIEKYF